MELRRIVWYWDSLVGRLQDSEPDLHQALRRSCQPLEAERHRGGLLTLALGCWWRPDLTYLGRQTQQARLNRALGRMLEERLQTALVAWPGGMAEGPASEETVAAPDLLSGLPPEAREEAARCESPIQRYFYAQAYRRGLRPRCQYVLLRYCLDFAFLEQRVAAEVVGWEWHRQGRGAGIPREREEQIGVENWRLRWFSGGEVLADVGSCLDEIDRLLASTQGLMTRRWQEPPDERRDSLRGWPRYERRPRRG